MTRSALRLAPSGDAAIVKVPTGDQGLLDIYKALDCRLIDICYGWLETGAGRVLVNLVIDDEGRLVDNPDKNLAATFMRGGPIYGTVLVFGEIDEDGEMLSLDNATLDALEDELIGLKRYENVADMMDDIHARLMMSYFND